MCPIPSPQDEGSGLKNAIPLAARLSDMEQRIPNEAVADSGVKQRDWDAWE